MRIIKLDSSDEDTFKFSILNSLHYYDIPHNPERIYKLIAFENKYNFSHNTPREFEIDNPDISLTVFDEDERIIYSWNNYNTVNKAAIVKINNDRYAAIKLIEDNYIKLKELLQSFSRTELSNLRFQKILRNYSQHH